MPARYEITSYFQRLNTWVTQCRAVEAQDVRAEKRTPVEGY
jgi:hypothetical protein